MLDLELYEVLRAAGEAALVTSPEGTILFANHPCEGIFGLPAEKLIGRQCNDLVQGTGGKGETICGPDCPIRAAAIGGQPIAAFQIEASTSMGGRRWLCMSTLSAHTRAGDRCIHLFRDADASHRLETATRHLLEEVAGLTGEELDTLLPTPHPNVDPGLTEREREILRCLCDGLGTGAIARQLHMSVLTARNHIQHILHKLHAHCRAEAVAHALRDRIV